MNNFFWKLVFFHIFNLIPSRIRRWYTLKSINIKYSDPELLNLVYKIADTETEILQALELLQKEYHKKSLVDNNESGVRLTKYNLLPSTIIFIAKDIKSNKVVGTVSLIYDSHLKLPIDSFSDISKLRSRGERICEISGLAVDDYWKKKGSSIFVALGTIATNYSYKVLGAKYNVCVVSRLAKFFYEDIFLFTPLKAVRKRYEFVKSSYASALYLDLTDYKEKFFRFYKNTPPTKNIFKAFFNPLWKKQVEVEKYKYSLVARQRFSSRSIYKFMSLHPKVLNNLTLQELMTLKNIYSDLNIELNFLGGLKNSYLRLNSRIQTYMKIQIEYENVVELSSCYDISESGLCFKSQQSFNEGDELKLTISFNSEESATIFVKVVWCRSFRVGAIIVLHNTLWDHLYKSLSDEYYYSVDEDLEISKNDQRIAS